MIWLKKTGAGFLLLLFFAVTAIKVLHFHSSDTISAAKMQLKKNGFPNCHTPVTDIKCFICDYQLTKDADDTHSIYYINCPTAFNTAAQPSHIFTLQSKYVVFETRGPPSV